MDLLIKAGLKVDVFGKCGIPFPIKSRWDPAFHEIVGRYGVCLTFGSTTLLFKASNLSSITVVLVGPILTVIPKSIIMRG